MSEGFKDTAVLGQLEVDRMKQIEKGQVVESDMATCGSVAPEAACLIYSRKLSDGDEGEGQRNGGSAPSV
jgi:hypothetical protein